MRHKVHLRIEGHAGFDLQGTALRLSKVIPGAVKERVHDGSPLAAAPKTYWVSESTPCSDQYPEDVLAKLLDQIVPVLRSDIASAPDIDITAVIVSEYEDGEEPSGYFLDRTLIAALGGAKAKLEIDSVKRLSE